MKRLLVLLALLFAVPASAATRWVRPAATGTGSGVDSSNAMTLASANAAVVAGDVVRILSGTYTTPIQPRANGTSGSRIYYYGWQNGPNLVTVAGINFGGVDTGTNASWGDYVTVKWVTTTASVLQDVHLRSGNYYACHDDSVLSVRATSGAINVIMNGYNSVWDSLSIVGTGVLQMEPHVNTYPAFGWMVKNQVFRNSTFTSSRSQANNGSNAYFFEVKTAKYCAIYNNVFNFTATHSNSGYLAFMHFYLSQYNNVNDNTFNLVDNSTTTGTKIAFSLRDSSHYNQMFRNTWNISGSPSRPTHIYASNDGGSYNADGLGTGLVGDNHWNGNVIRNSIATSVPFYWQAGAWRDTVQFNLFATSGTANAVQSDSRLNSVIFRHNTLYTAGGTVFSHSTGTTSSSKAVSNVFYGTSANGAGAAASVIVTSGFALDSLGLIFNRGGTSSNAIRYAGTNGAPASGANYGLSTKAVWNTPKFADSTYATLNATLAAGSPADDNNLHDGYAGVYGAASADVTAPAAITDLAAVASGSTGAVLSWTAPHEDGAGGGNVAGYDVRYSTSAITAGNFGSATNVPFSDHPADAGYPESFVISGLSAATTYYFAVKSTDEVPNTSAVSNFPAAITTAAASGPNNITALSDTANAGFNSIGFRLGYTGDDNADATCQMYYRVEGSTAAYDSAVTMQRIKGNRFATTLFWLTPETNYDCKIVVTDPDGGSTEFYRTLTTRTYQPLPVSQAQIWVATSAAGGSDANPGTEASPKATLTAAANAATAGGQVRVKAGVYYDSLRVTKKISIVGEPGAIIDGSRADIRNTTWTQFAASGVYFLRNIRPAPYVVSVGPQRTLYHSKGMSDSTGRTGLWNETVGAFFYRNDTLYVKLADGSTPTGKQMNISGISNLFEVASDSVRVDSLTLRNYGTVISSIGILLGTAFSTDAEYCMVRGVTGYNMGGPLVYDNAGQQNNLIENCTASDSMLYRYGYAAVKSGIQEISGFILNARNGTIRNCTVTGMFNGFGVASAGSKTNEQPGADTAIHDNLVMDCSDDAYEVDLGCAINMRLYNNRAIRTNNGISVAPTFTGPTYIIYNTLFNQAEGGFKHGDGGVSDSSYGHRFFYHNTVVSSGSTGYRGAHASAGGKFANNTYANNIFATANKRIIADDTAADNYGTNSFNFNLLNSTNNPKLTWKNTSMTHYNSWRLTYSMEANIDTSAAAFRDSANYDFRPLSPTAGGVDRGRRIPGINTRMGGYSGTAPDMGAWEWKPQIRLGSTKRRRVHL